MTEAVVRAGGGIVWRRVEGAVVEIVLIHRPAYDDWSFPKGKLHPGETEAQAALREVEEETGLRCRLGREVGTAAYRDPKRRPKDRPLLGDDPDRRHPRTGERDRRRALGATPAGRYRAEVPMLSRMRFHPTSSATASSTMTPSATAVAGPSANVVAAKVNSTTTVLVIATLNTSLLAPVSPRTRKWAAVISVNTSSAMALPIEAIELRSNPTASTIATAAVISSPAGARPPNRRPSTGG